MKRLPICIFDDQETTKGKGQRKMVTSLPSRMMAMKSVVDGRGWLTIGYFFLG